MKTIILFAVTLAVCLAPMALEAHSLATDGQHPASEVDAVPAPAYVAPVRVHYNAAYTCSRNMYRSIDCR